VSLKVVPKPPVILKLFRKLAMVVHWRKSTNESEGKLEYKFYSDYGTIFRISKCFQTSIRNLTFIFLLNKTGLKFRQKIIAYQKFYRPSKNAHLVTQSLENRKYKDDLTRVSLFDSR
jgi:hypothetical protein